VYVHVPFCARRCSYCDFSIAVRREVPWREFAAQVARELSLRGEVPREVETLYFGGGTPSRLGSEGMAALLDAVRAVALPVAGAECTLEVNPEDVTPAAARAWVDAGVNRVSLGVQSFQDPVLQWMHRVHDAAAVPRAFDTLRDAGLLDISVDLIFAVPRALERDWAADVERALALQPTHVSLYGLTVEPGTPLGRWAARGATLEAPDESYEVEFLLAHEAFTAAGFEHYEVSNYGRPGHRARHNAAYWRGVPYLGLGPSAHGFDGTVRRWNQRAYRAWGTALAAGRDPIEGDERLTPENQLAEAVYLGLRTVDGLHTTAADDPLLDVWRRAGWIEAASAERVRCTPLGWLRLDALAAALTAHRSR
jgi:oxygen-independent coproporphyrinogen-3 oxidase